MRRCAKRDSHRGSERWERPSTDTITGPDLTNRGCPQRAWAVSPRTPETAVRRPGDDDDGGTSLSLSLSSRQGPGYPTYSRRCSLYPLVFVVGTLISRCRLLDDAVERCGLVLEAERLGVWIKVVAVEGEGDLGSAHFGEARSEDAQFRL